MALKRKLKVSEAFSMASMTDIIFLLLIFFMVVSTLVVPNAIKVNNALDYQTNIEGVYAIGDVNTYPGKLKLILCGFHEATLMCQSVYNRIYPNKKYVLKYTTVVGIDGFDGSRKEAEKAVVKAI